MARQQWLVESFETHRVGLNDRTRSPGGFQPRRRADIATNLLDAKLLLAPLTQPWRARGLDGYRRHENLAGCWPSTAWYATSTITAPATATKMLRRFTPVTPT